MPWTPPLSFEERLKRLVLPGRLQIRWRLRREYRRGEREIHLVPRLVDPARVSLDVGANRGVWAEAMRRHSREVLAFEPNPKLFADLVRGAGPGVRALPVALSDRDGVAELRVPRRARGYSNQGATLAHDSLGGLDYGAVQVETRRLDGMDAGDVGFIKIDVEGHELAVLRGAAGLLARCRPKLLIEMEEKHTQRPMEELLAEVCGYGYRSFCLLHGSLVPTQEVDLDRHHRAPPGRPDYIFNWVFLPA